MPTLVVQLGHCYRKSGATGTTGEQEYATRVGNACRSLLHGRGGWIVKTILADDPASSYVGDAFAAIHCDGSTSAAARGASVGYRTPEGQAFGQAWKRAYSARGWPGFRPDNYTDALRLYYGTGTAVSRGNERAIIVECGFRTNDQDRALLDALGGPERVALSLGDALGIPVAPPEVPDVNLTDSLAPHTWDNRVVPGAENVGNALMNMYNRISGIESVVARVLADALADPNTTEDRVKQLMAEAVRDNAPAPQPVDLEAIRQAVREAQEEDNEDLADAVVDKITARMAN